MSEIWTNYIDLDTTWRASSVLPKHWATKLNALSDFKMNRVAFAFNLSEIINIYAAHGVELIIPHNTSDETRLHDTMSKCSEFMAITRKHYEHACTKCSQLVDGKRRSYCHSLTRFNFIQCCT